MDGLLDPKIAIGVNRDITMTLHISKVLLVVTRMLTAAELEGRSSAFPFTSACLTKKCVGELLEKKDAIRNKLEEAAMGMPVKDYKLCLGENMYVTIDSDTSTVQIRRFWDSVDGPRPTRTGVAMDPNEMANLLNSVGSLHSQMLGSV